MLVIIRPFAASLVPVAVVVADPLVVETEGWPELMGAAVPEGDAELGTLLD